ncbi:MAG: hypothetical protein JWM21_2774 [Acidobacteria bacterium]|nr:hypothetical protein [Acidobacteriota bacterium]
MEEVRRVSRRGADLYGKLRAGRKINPEPRWPALVALLAVGGLHAALPSSLGFGGPRWLVLGVLGGLVIPALLFHRSGQHHLHHGAGYVLNTIVTVVLIWSLALLLRALAEHQLTPSEILRSAGALWLSNILVFASWYWHLDGGGPHIRELTPGHTDGAFLFPQMTMAPDIKIAAGEHEWEPNFVDYLFLAFNTSSAFSPTDVPVLSRWAKLLMMVQSLISLLVIALLAARAVNIL